MEIHPETEPLLIKDHENDEYNLIYKKELENKTISKEQILKKTWFDWSEYLCCCCIKYDITQGQYNLFNDLRNKCSIKYDENNIEHEKLLVDFFININELIQNEDEDYENMDNINIDNINNNNNELPKEKRLINKLSKRVGFQNNNPRTDFREGGFYSLQFMNYFITNYKIESKNILNEKSFPFAIVCINISFFLTLVLLLKGDKKSNEATLKSRKLSGCGRKQIKKFCEHLENENEKDLMFLIISQCLCYIFAKYIREMNNEKNDDNLISNIIDNSIQYFQETLDKVKKNEIIVDKLKSKLEEAKNKKLKLYNLIDKK